MTQLRCGTDSCNITQYVDSAGLKCTCSKCCAKSFIVLFAKNISII